MDYSTIAFLGLCVGWPAFWVILVVGFIKGWWLKLGDRLQRGIENRRRMKSLKNDRPL